MLAARLCQVSLLRVPQLGANLARQPVLAKTQVPSQGFLRNFGNESRTRSRVFTRRGEAKTVTPPGTVPTTPYHIGQGVVAGAAAIGIGALAYYGLGLSSSTQIGTAQEAYLWPKYVRDRVKDTYLYLAGSLGLTAVSTVAIYRTPSVLRLFNAQGFMGMILPLVALIGVGTAMRSMPYEPGKFGAKNFMWVLHSSLVGGIIAPLCILGGPLMLRAAYMTAGVVGGLSAIAVCAPSDKFLNIGAPLGIGLGVVFASCIGTWFLPPTTMAGASLHSVAIYGGVLLFSMMLLYHTQMAMKRAQAVPAYQVYDPINASAGMYMSIINIFIDIVNILAMQKRK